jgi:hypothetical protein
MGDQAAHEYYRDIWHDASSSSQPSACSVEPGSVADVSKIVRYLDLMHELLSTHILIATYTGIEPNSFCSERRRTHHEPRFFLD